MYNLFKEPMVNLHLKSLTKKFISYKQIVFSKTHFDNLNMNKMVSLLKKNGQEFLCVVKHFLDKKNVEETKFNIELRIQAV